MGLHIVQWHVKESGVSQHEAVCSSAALAWATVSVPNQKHQETEMGHVCQFVRWHRTHPIIFVAHPEHKSPEIIGRFSPCSVKILITIFHPWCLGVSCGVNHRKDVAADNQRPTHAPPVSLCVYEHVNMFKFMWKCEEWKWKCVELRERNTRDVLFV